MKPHPLHVIFRLYLLAFRLRGGASGYPGYILIRAAQLNYESVEARYYGLYNKILQYWFRSRDYYDINPQWGVPGSRKAIDFVVSFNIEGEHRPLLLLEVKPPSDFLHDSGRENALEQLLTRIEDLGPANHHASRLYAISAIGKHWRACYTSRGNGRRGSRPVKCVAEENSLKTANRTSWNSDIMSNASWKILYKIVNRIKQDVRQCRFFRLLAVWFLKRQTSKCLNRVTIRVFLGFQDFDLRRPLMQPCYPVLLYTRSSAYYFLNSDSV
jgi:hypothetical protein